MSDYEDVYAILRTRGKGHVLMALRSFLQAEMDLGPLVPEPCLATLHRDVSKAYGRFVLLKRSPGDATPEGGDQSKEGKLGDTKTDQEIEIELLRRALKHMTRTLNQSHVRHASDKVWGGTHTDLVLAEAKRALEVTPRLLREYREEDSK